MRITLVITAVFAIFAGRGNGQSFPFRASVTGNGNPQQGKCTIEVVVDGSAEVEIRGENAILRNLSGRPPQWRRFQCSGVMPLAPAGFRFAGIDGRGRQTLIREPGDGGPAVIRIDDPDNGSEGYTFDVMWNGIGQPRGFDRDRDRRPPDDDDRFRDRGRFDDDDRFRDRRRWTIEEAQRACEEAIIDQAYDRLHAQAIAIRQSRPDDGPGRNDWIVGVFDARRGRDWDRFSFSCSADFSSGRLRSADFQPIGRR